MRKTAFSRLTVFLLLAVASPAFAQQTYNVTIDATALAGQAGSIVFDMTHLNSSDNNATITNFSFVDCCTVTNESIGTGDGATTSFMHTTAHTPITPATLAIFYTVSGSQFEAEDNGAGMIFGLFDGTTGTVDYATGAISIVFATAPDAATPITANYLYGTIEGTPSTVGGFTEGDIILGKNPASTTTMDENYFGTPFFFSELAIPFSNLGTTITFSITLSQNYDGVLPFDEFAFFVLNANGQTFVPSSDPLLANSLFDICVDGSSAGIFNAYTPAMFMMPGTLDVTLTIPPLAANVTNVMPASSSGGPGQTVAAGSFTVQNNSGSPVSMSGGMLSISDPSAFSSLGLVGSMGGSAVVGAPAPAVSSSLFNFDPPLMIPASGSATFNLSGSLSSAENAAGTSNQMLTSVSASSAGNAISIGGLSANLGSVSNSGPATATATATPTATATATATRTATPTATPSPGLGTVSVSPNAVDFGSSTPVNKTSKAKKVTIKNTSSKSSKIKVTVMGEITAAPFAIKGKECTKTLAPGKSCKVSVTFTPPDTSPHMGTLTVNDTATNAPQKVTLTGTGK